MAEWRHASILLGQSLAKSGIAGVCAYRTAPPEKRLLRDILRARNPDMRNTLLGASTILSPLHPFLCLQVTRVVDGKGGCGIEKVGFALRILQPCAPFLVAVLIAVDVFLCVAEYQVEQSRDLLPDRAHIGFPRAIERNREQNVVLRFEHCDAD